MDLIRLRMKHTLLLIVLLISGIIPNQAQTQINNSTINDVAQHLPMASVLVLKACGMGSNEAWATTLTTCAATYLIGTGATWALKQTTNELRPDGSDRHSLPSGHAMYAFAGATVLRHECGKKYP